MTYEKTYEIKNAVIKVTRKYKKITKSLDILIKSLYNEYNSSRYLISAIIKNVNRNVTCEI